jgi:hypothetical protein
MPMTVRDFHDQNRLSFCAIKEERDCYAASLTLGIRSLRRCTGGPAAAREQRPGQPILERVRLLVPGFK